MSVIHGDCLDVMATLDAESIDAIVTDPPYGLEFMGKEWDKLGAEMEGFAWIGIEKEAESVAIAEARLNGTQKGLGL
jgi:DNA modification methylase